MCVEFGFVFDQRSGCDRIAGTDSRRSAGPAFVRDELRALSCDLHNLHRSDARIREVLTPGIKGELPSFDKNWANQTYGN
jgi:hypothetical protein